MEKSQAALYVRKFFALIAMLGSAPAPAAHRLRKGVGKSLIGINFSFSLTGVQSQVEINRWNLLRTGARHG